MAATENRIILLQELLVKIETRRRTSDGSIPEPEEAAAAHVSEEIEFSEEFKKEAIPFIPEEFEVKPEEPAEEEPVMAAAPDDEEEEIGEVTDKVQVIPPIPEAFKLELKKEETTMPWFNEQKRKPEAGEEMKTKEAFDFPEVEEEALKIKTPAIDAPTEEKPIEPEIIKAKPPIRKAKPFATTGVPTTKQKPTIGTLLARAFTVGEPKDN